LDQKALKALLLTLNLQDLKAQKDLEDQRAQLDLTDQKFQHL